MSLLPAVHRVSFPPPTYWLFASQTNAKTPLPAPSPNVYYPSSLSQFTSLAVPWNAFDLALDPSAFESDAWHQSSRGGVIIESMKKTGPHSSAWHCCSPELLGNSGLLVAQGCAMVNCFARIAQIQSGHTQYLWRVWAHRVWLVLEAARTLGMVFGSGSYLASLYWVWSAVLQRLMSKQNLDRVSLGKQKTCLYDTKVGFCQMSSLCSKACGLAALKLSKEEFTRFFFFNIKK